jgi:hypothetical protein
MTNRGSKAQRLKEALASYQQALSEFTHGLDSYSVIEIAKIEVADALLSLLGYSATDPISPEQTEGG